MEKSQILIVDDELIIRESLAAWLQRDGHQIEALASGEDALQRLQKKRFDILFLDLKLEGMDGIEVLKQIKDIDQDITVVMITAYGSVATAVEAMKNGAYDYLMKPFEPEELSVLIERIMEQKARERENIYLKEKNKERNRFENLIGQSQLMQELFDFIQDIAPSESTILITGETGTGKELAAKAIHSNSYYAQGPFVAVNCGAFNEDLLETELFGYEKGAFTDAKTTKKGRLELAWNGTLFLDEIGEISQRMQIDLLRVLEERYFYRVGGNHPIETNFRVIAATNKNLEKAVQEGNFREDFYYRLKVISLEMPPLKKRKEDIPLLAEHFRQRFTEDINKNIDSISREALDELMLYDWPGNIRELENAIERAVVVGKKRQIQPRDLPISSTNQIDPEDESLQNMEKSHILKILQKNSWNIQQSAQALGIDRSTLYKKIKRYNLR